MTPWTLAFALAAVAPTAAPPDAPITCGNCEKWNAPVAPFRVYGNTYYVGVAGLASVLIASPKGLIVLDGGLPQSAPLIEDNIRKLGFRVEDIKLIVNSHAHFDHAGGIAALARDSGAQVAASVSGAAAIRQGAPTADDPQVGYDMHFPAVATVRAVADGETLRVGKLAITAHTTPGHTPGSTVWTWKSCDAGRCLDIVYADSLNAIAAPGFRYSGDSGHADVAQSFRRSIEKVAALPCDIVLSVHPDVTGMFEKLERRRAGASPDPFIDGGGCRAYAETAQRGLAQRLLEEDP